MITLFGATGYTGQLIAQQLDQSGFPFQIAGRSAAKLAELSEQLGTHPAYLVADALQPDTLSGLFRDTKVLINCAGPFTDLGEKVITQAALNGVHYLDITNELGFVYRAQTYNQLAKQTHAILIPACAFEVAFADFAAAQISSILPGPYQQADVIYHLPGKGSSIGTRRSAIRSLATSWITYRGGQWVGEAPGRTSRIAALESGPVPVIGFPSSESVTFPAHLPVQSVSTWMTTSPAGRFWGPIFIPFFARLMRSVLREPVLQLAGNSPPLPSGLRSYDPFEVRVSLTAAHGARHASIIGQGAYDLTARIILFAALKLLNNPPDTYGVLPPSALCSPSEFFDTAKVWGVTIQEGSGA